MFLTAIVGTVLISIYRMFKPPPLKSLHNEIAIVIFHNIICNMLNIEIFIVLINIISIVI